MADSSGDKTEKATPKKRQDSRKKGQVLKSTEVNTAVSMITMFAALSLFGGYIVRNGAEILTRYLGSRLLEKITIGNAPSVWNEAIFILFRTALPLLLVAVVIGVAINIVQVGLLFTTASIKPKFSKINPLQGLKRILSMRSLVEMVKSILKISIVGYLVYSEFMKQLKQFPLLMNYGVIQSGAQIFSLCLAVGFKASMALVAIGVIDYMYNWMDFEKNLRMTKQEIKDEYKMIEGDPQVKGKRKQKQREIANMRMMQAVPQADVVITNPTHYAVALKYDDTVAAAPVLVAKGKDLTALRIRQTAQAAGVGIVENKAVAQAIYQTVDVGRQVPAELFQAVAEILAYVYNMKT